MVGAAGCFVLDRPAVEPVASLPLSGAAGSLVLRPRVFFWLLGLSCGCKMAGAAGCSSTGSPAVEPAALADTPGTAGSLVWRDRVR